MRISRLHLFGLSGLLSLVELPLYSALRTETFDREPARWEGVNHRNAFFELKTVTQDYGYSAKTSHAGGQPGEIGGRINPAGEISYYGYKLSQPLTLDQAIRAEGRLSVAPGPGNWLLGFFNTNTLGEWRTPNTVVARINSRGEVFHCHLEYCTSKWRAGAGVIGEIVPGERITATEIPCGKMCQWELTYDPRGANQPGLLTFLLNGVKAECEIPPDHRRDGITLTHFGLLPVAKSWDNAGEMWVDDLRVGQERFDFSRDPSWDSLSNRVTYVSSNTRPKFDFGWSPTRHAGGQAPGELGGLIFRGDCREPARMGSYGDRLELLTLNAPIEARGKVAMLRGISDSTASIGFYHSVHSMQSNPSQKNSIPMDFLGINIEGPSSEGFYFYPVYRMHGDAAKVLSYGDGKAPKINPDRQVHDWFLRYDPTGANGNGQITVGLDEQICVLILEPGHKQIGATFNRFGICTPWVDGNSVTAYFDDLTYTSAP